MSKKTSRKAGESKKRRARRVHPGESPLNEIHSPEPSTLSGSTFTETARPSARGTGLKSAGQAGDLQGLSRAESVDSESVEELAAEGQYHEAEIVSAVENVPDPEKGALRTREVLQDDVPEEYLNND